MNSIRPITVALILFSSVCAIACADTISVNWDGSGDYAAIQPAIEAATDGDEVVVEPGTYTGPGNRYISLMGRAITVRSAKGPAETVIDCEKTEQAFLVHSGEKRDSVIDGFTITNGAAGTGGAIWFIYPASMTIRNCVFRQNNATGSGGAISCQGSPRIMNCIFDNNEAGKGGAICCDYSCPLISNCVMIENAALTGGAVYCASSCPAITSCTMIRNDAQDRGGGLFMTHGSCVIATNNIIWDNTAPLGPQLVLAASSPDSELRVRHCNVQGGESAVLVEPGNTLKWETENIDADPRFVFEGDYHLLPSSPCINAGQNSSAVQYADITTDDGAQNTVIVEKIGWHMPGDEIEYDNDGTLRTVTHVDLNSSTLTIEPPFGTASLAGKAIGNYGQGDIDGDNRILFNTIDIGADEMADVNAYTGDFDQDADVDLEDAEFFQACATGPQIVQPDTACLIADFDNDGDIDQSDFGTLQRCLSGENILADPACAD